MIGTHARAAVAGLVAAAVIAAGCAGGGSPKPAAEIGQDAWEGRRLIYPEVEAVAAAVGSDGAKLLQFVSHGLGYDAYRGALRGPRGTILAGAGNAADKSLLLRDVIRIVDPAAEVRFAFCTLARDQAAELAATATAQRPATPAAPRPPSAATPEEQAAVQRLGDQWRAAGAAIAQDVRTVAGALAQGGVTLTAPNLTGMEIEQAVAEHVWVQRREPGGWTDLDPTMPAPGRTRCRPERTARELPETMFHHLAISVRLEERDGSTLSTRYLLETFWRTAELTGSTITFAHPEALALDDALLTNPSAPPQGASRYTPMLMIDDEYALGDAFLLPRPGGELHETVARGFGEITRRLEPGPQPAPPGPQVTAEWLEFTVRSPDGATETIERPVFDRIGYSARAYGEEDRAPLAALEEIGGEYAALATVVSVATWTGEKAIAAPLADPASWDPRTRAPFEALGAYHRAFYGLRESLLDAAPGAGARFVATDTGLSVLTWTLGFDSDQPGAGVFTTDLTRAPVRSVGGGQPGAPPVGIVWGAAGLRAERLLLTAPAALLGEARGEEPALAPDVAAVFDRAVQDGVRTLLLRPADAAQVVSIASSEDARTRLWQRLDAGSIVLVPERAVPVDGEPVLGWWLFDPARGLARDEMETGLHQGGTERSALEKDNAKKQAAASNMRCAFQRALNAIATVVYLVGVVGGGTTAPLPGGGGGGIKIPPPITKTLGEMLEAGGKMARLCGAQRKKPSPGGGRPKAPRGSPPTPPKPRPPKKIPPPEGKDRYGWGPKNPSRGVNPNPMRRFH